MQMLKGIFTTLNLSGEIVADDVSYEQFLRGFDGQHVEWINGVVIQMSPVTARHNDLNQFLVIVLKFYLPLTGGGRVFQDPMVMHLIKESRGRAPDVQMILPEHFHLIKENEIAGPADLVIEIVSPDSQRRDRVEKFAEYERAGVKEYWILDPIRKEPLFNVLGEDGLYALRPPDVNGVYRSIVLPRLRLPVALFWRDPLPEGPEIARMVEDMLKDQKS